MIQLLLRADDLGYSEAVNYGIAKTVRQGIIGSVGLMPSMPAAEHGLRLLEGTSVWLGQHTDICIGQPVCPPEEIPSLVTEDGQFKSSRVYRAAYASGKDFVALEDAVRECEAQYRRYLELVGEKPRYFGGHAVASEQFFQALEIVAQRHGLKNCPPSFAADGSRVGDIPVNICRMDSMNPDYDAVLSLKKAVAKADERKPNIYICHPGYLDAYILQNSSLTVNRTKEVEMLCDGDVVCWLDEQGVQRITYDDIN